MVRKLISSDSPFEQKIAYSRAVIDGDYVFVSGTTGYDYQTMQISDDVSQQTEQCLINIEKVLKQAQCRIKDIVRITYILPDKKDFSACWPILQKWLADVLPAATMFEAGLMDDAMKIEIQVTARANQQPSQQPNQQPSQQPIHRSAEATQVGFNPMQPRQD